MSKLDEIRKQVEGELAEVRRARTELQEEELLLRLEEAALKSKLEVLSGSQAASPGASLQDRIVQVVTELEEASPSEIVESLRIEDPGVKPNSVRAMLGQLVASCVIAKKGRGCYVPAA